MQIKNHLYSFSYDDTESELCKLESKYIFNQEERDRLLFSDIEVEPSTSAFIKKRLDISLYSQDYARLIEKIKELKLRIEGFKVEYLVLNGDTTEYRKRLDKLRDIGYSIEGNPEYYKPVLTYGLCYYENTWFFGTLIKNNYQWEKHKQKPFSYSNSININIAKALVNMAAKTDKEASLLDACCGVGTIMLEACFAGHQIEGCEINWKICRQARENMAHFNYTGNVYRSDIKDIDKRYDAAIIDLPYNLFSCADIETVVHIIESTAKLTNRMLVVSISDISSEIRQAGFEITDTCSICKKGKVNFVRKIWVCEKC